PSRPPSRARAATSARPYAPRPAWATATARSTTPIRRGRSPDGRAAGRRAGAVEDRRVRRGARCRPGRGSPAREAPAGAPVQRLIAPGARMDDPARSSCRVSAPQRRAGPELFLTLRAPVAVTKEPLPPIDVGTV